MYYRQMYCRLSFTCRIFSNSSLLLLEQRQGHPLGIHEVWLPGKASTGNWKYSEYHIICSSPTFPILAAKCVHQLVVQVTSFWLFSSCRYVGSTVPFSFSPRSLDTSNLLSCRPPATFRSIFAHLIEQEKHLLLLSLGLSIGVIKAETERRSLRWRAPWYPYWTYMSYSFKVHLWCAYSLPKHLI